MEKITADITIIMPSYNKERYIAQALDSVFAQETNYKYHIIVADDCSQDKTVEIVKEYQTKYPDKITLLTSTQNNKLYRNVLRAYEITKTEYFCVLDPDDYWTDKRKIQKALDFLQEHTDYTIYVTGTEMLLPDGTKKDFLKYNKVINSSFADFLNDKAALGCTLGSTFRNVVFKHGIPDKMRNLESDTMERSFRGDTFRNILHLHSGKAHCVPETDAVYRITEEGIWQGISELEQNLLNANIFKDLWLYFDKKYPELLVKSYKISNKINIDLLIKLSEIKDSGKLKDITEKLINLQLIFTKNQDIINKTFFKSINLKYKMIFLLYKNLYNKLMRKGLI